MTKTTYEFEVVTPFNEPRTAMELCREVDQLQIAALVAPYRKEWEQGWIRFVWGTFENEQNSIIGLA